MARFSHKNALFNDFFKRIPLDEKGLPEAIINDILSDRNQILLLLMTGYNNTTFNDIATNYKKTLVVATIRIIFQRIFSFSDKLILFDIDEEIIAVYRSNGIVPMYGNIPKLRDIKVEETDKDFFRQCLILYAAYHDCIVETPFDMDIDIALKLLDDFIVNKNIFMKKLEILYYAKYYEKNISTITKPEFYLSKTIKDLINAECI